MLLVGGYLAVRSSPVQTWLAQQLAGSLSEQVGVKIRIEKLDLEWLRTLSLKGVHIQDQKGDTLLHASAVKGRIAGFAFFDQMLRFDQVELHRPHVELKRYRGKSALSHEFLLDGFSSEDSSGSSWTVETDGLEVEQGTFEFHDLNASEQEKGRIDFKDLRLEGIGLDLINVDIDGDSVGAQIQDLAFLEMRSGFRVDSLRTDAAFSMEGIRADSLFVRTPQSQISGDIRFMYEAPQDMQEWVEEVDMHGDLDRSRLASEDLAFFVEELDGIGRTLDLRGKVRGKVSELRLKEFLLEWTPDTYFKGDIELSGLPNLPSTFITIEADRLSAKKTDLERIPLVPFEEERTLSLPTQLERLGNISFQGRLTGFVNDLVAYGTLNSDQGQLRTDVEFSRDTSTGRFSYDGEFKAVGFNVGSYYRIPKMGRIDAKMEVKGYGFGIDRIHTKLDGTIDRFEYRKYGYKDISLKGTLHNRHFSGSMKTEDPNFDFDFNGSIDLRQEIPSYSFTMDIHEFRPGVLNWVEQDSSVSLTTRLEFEGEGMNLADLRGELEANETVYRRTGLTYELGNLELSAEKIQDGRSISFLSSPVVASLKGKFDLPDLIDHFNAQLQKVLPTLFKEGNMQRSLTSEQDLKFDIKLLRDPPLLDLVFPKWDFHENTVLSGSFDSKADDFHLNVFAPKLSYERRRMSEINLKVHRRKDVLEADLISDTLFLSDSLYFNDFQFIGKALENNLQFQTDWSGGEPDTEGNIESVFLAKGPNSFELELLSSSFTIGGKKWGLAPDGKFSVDGPAYRFKDIRLGDGSRSIKVDGSISKAPADELEVEFNDFQLSILAPFLSDKLNPKGIVNGKAVASDLYNEPLFESNISVDSAGLAGHSLGDLQVSSRWMTDQNFLNLQASLEESNSKTLSVSGKYTPSNEKPLDLELNTDNLRIAVLNGLLDGGLSNIKGNISGPLQLGGSLKEPVLTGDITAKDVSLKVNALNVRYGFDDERITFYEDMIGFDHVPVYYINPETGEKMKGKGRATGTLIHDHFKSWNFNIFLEFEKMLALDLKQKMNDRYYGTAYGSGEVEISGYPGTLSINVDARTERGTDLKLPLGGDQEVSMENFVSFVDRDAEVEDKGITQKELEGVDMTFDLNITPEAKINIIFDEKIGDVMKGSGSGNIKMEVNSNGKFKMYGDLKVYEGDYLFTMKNVINKRFNVQKGGTIEWFGDPYKANIKLDAIYELRTSIYPLMYGMESQEAYRERIPVELIMHLSKDLMNPNISFEIEFPTLQENQRAIAMSRIKSMNKQAFSLLVLKRFIKEQGDRSQGANIGSNTSSELLSNQLSNWLSSISEDFDLGVNYTPGDQVNNEELAVALSTQLFNERVSLRGNLGVSSAREQGQQQGRDQNSLVGDFTIEYDITADGKFRLKVFNESNDDRISQQIQRSGSEYTQGVGVFYEEAFDSADELLDQIGNLFKRDRPEAEGKK